MLPSRTFLGSNQRVTVGLSPLGKASAQRAIEPNDTSGLSPYPLVCVKEINASLKAVS